MTRVQIPAYRDEWMQGDRFGEIVKTTRAKTNLWDDMSQLATRDRIMTKERWKAEIEIAHVKLDKSGKTVRVILADCEVLKSHEVMP